MPSSGWYLVGLLVAVLGLGGAALYFFSHLAVIDDGVTRMVAPGETTMALQPGTYTVFHEYSSVVDGRSYQANDIAGLRVTVASRGGMPLVLRSTADTNYGLAGRKGRSVWAFDIGTAGDYRLSASYEAASGPQTVLAVAQGFIGRVFVLILGTGAIACLAIGAGLGIASIAYIKRHRQRLGDIVAGTIVVQHRLRGNILK